VVFQRAAPYPNASPAEGYRHFGEVEIDRQTRAFTVRLRDLDGRVLWTTTLPAA
jgi:alkaline phosphatase D